MIHLSERYWLLYCTLSVGNCCACKVVISEDRVAALEWQATKSAADVIAARENVMCEIERKGKEFWSNGSAQNWLDSAEPTVRKVVESVNGPLLMYLGEKAMHADLECIELLRRGAPLYGQLETCGNGPVKDSIAIGEIDELKANCSESNVQLIKKLRNDPWEQELHNLALEDAKLGRMTWPEPVSEEQIRSVRLNQRFGVEQGLKPNGDVKVRAVDNMSWGYSSEVSRPKKRPRQSVNGCSAIPEKIMHHHVDDLAVAIKLFIQLMACIPGLIKADVKAAFRRIPLLPAHRWAAAIAYKLGDEVMVACHNACMFGASSSVYNWERIGELITVIAIKWLGICVYRYVDDFFAPERAESMEHAMQCIARLVRAVLGHDAIENRKLDCGLSLVVLGVRCQLSTAGLCLFPEPSKVQKWAAGIRDALKNGILCAGASQKLAGRLSWAQTHMFHKLGRAMIRPIFDQRWSRSGMISKELRAALLWWLHVLEMGICEQRQWQRQDAPPVWIFVDARGVPPRCAAVAFIDGVCHFTDGEPSKAIMECFQKRKDAQICGLEMLAIALGLSSFAEELRGRNVVIFSDNKGAEAAARKGTAKSWDHCQIIHEIWTMAFQIGAHLWIERVPTDDNISDLPSRTEYALLYDEFDAQWREPVIGRLFLDM